MRDPWGVSVFFGGFVKHSPLLVLLESGVLFLSWGRSRHGSKHVALAVG